MIVLNSCHDCKERHQHCLEAAAPDISRITFHSTPSYSSHSYWQQDTFQEIERNRIWFCLQSENCLRALKWSRHSFISFPYHEAHLLEFFNGTIVKRRTKIWVKPSMSLVNQYSDKTFTGNDFNHMEYKRLCFWNMIVSIQKYKSKSAKQIQLKVDKYLQQYL